MPAYSSGTLDRGIEGTGRQHAHARAPARRKNGGATPRARAGGRATSGENGVNDRGTGLDGFDLKILSVLQRQGRMKKVELAAAIGLTPSPCWERLRRLEKAGIITGYHAEIDLARVLRAELVIVTVTLGSHEAEGFRRFEEAVAGVPEILDCFAVGGGVDYVLRLVVVDIGAYQSLMEGLLERGIGIHQYTTYIVTKAVKRARGYPLEHLLSRGPAPGERAG